MGALRDAMRDVDDAYTAGRLAGWVAARTGVPDLPPAGYSETQLDAWHHGYKVGAGDGKR